MVIKFRFHRGGLKESLATMRTFTSWEQLRAFLVHESRHGVGDAAFSVDDIVISPKRIHDRRIGWKDSRYVCVKRYGDQIYNTPQCIGYVATEFSEPTDLSWQK